MNPDLRIAGDQLAKSVARRSEALETLNTESRKWNVWHLCLTIAVGVGISWFGGHAGANGVFVVYAATGAGFLLAANAYFECIRLRKRLDAAIVLLLESDRLPSRIGSASKNIA